MPDTYTLGEVKASLYRPAGQPACALRLSGTSGCYGGQLWIGILGYSLAGRLVDYVLYLQLVDLPGPMGENVRSDTPPRDRGCPLISTHTSPRGGSTVPETLGQPLLSCDLSPTSSPIIEARCGRTNTAEGYAVLVVWRGLDFGGREIAGALH